ncbi:MAG: ATP phosphoribosyltransferase regulatory subunit, partial [Blautia sp.]
MQRIFHTPEGVRDVYREECGQKLFVQRKIRQIFHSYGYCDIETPTFEFFEVFSREVGTTPSKELYKFFDREGNTLVLRPDFTPSIARCAASCLPLETEVACLCYTGNTFVNHSSFQGRLKEATQMGV